MLPKFFFLKSTLILERGPFM